MRPYINLGPGAREKPAGQEPTVCDAHLSPLTSSLASSNPALGWGWGGAEEIATMLAVRRVSRGSYSHTAGTMSDLTCLTAA